MLHLATLLLASLGGCESLFVLGGGEGGGKNEKYVKEMEGYCFPAVLDETHGSVPLELRSLVAESRFVLETHQLKKAQMT